MSVLSNLWRLLDAWFAAAVPVAAGPAPERADDDADRASVRDVTLEQLGIDHWSSHTLF